MKKTRFTAEQMVTILPEADQKPVAERGPDVSAVASGSAAGAREAAAPTRGQQPSAAAAAHGREHLSLQWFRNRADAKVSIEAWRRHYNGCRSSQIHQATAIAITTGKLTYTGTDTMNANAAAEPATPRAIAQAAFARR